MTNGQLYNFLTFCTNSDAVRSESSISFRRIPYVEKIGPDIRSNQLFSPSTEDDYRTRPDTKKVIKLERKANTNRVDDKRSVKADLAKWKCEMKEEDVNETGGEMNDIKRRILRRRGCGAGVEGAVCRKAGAVRAPGPELKSHPVVMQPSQSGGWLLGESSPALPSDRSSRVHHRTPSTPTERFPTKVFHRRGDSPVGILATAPRVCGGSFN